VIMIMVMIMKQTCVLYAWSWLLWHFSMLQTCSSYLTGAGINLQKTYKKGTFKQGTEKEAVGSCGWKRRQTSRLGLG